MENIKTLRKKQFIFVNIILVIGYSIFLYFVFQRNTYVHDVNGFLGILLVILSIFHFASMEKNIHFSEWMRQLQAHEKEKLGPEWKKSKKSNAIATLFLGIMFLIQYINSLPHREFVMPVNNSHLYPYIIYLILFFMVIVNVGLYFNMKKIDGKSTEELAGFTKRELVTGLIVGTVVAVLVLVVTLTIAATTLP